MWSNILLWVGSAFELYEWLENLGTVPLQLRSHISSLKLYDLYKPLHCIHTHTHAPRYTENTKQPRRALDFRYSNPKNETFEFFLGETAQLHHKQRVQPVRFYERPSVCRVHLNARILRDSFQRSTKFRRKGKGNLKRERRGKAQLGAAKKSQTGRTTGV